MSDERHRVLQWTGVVGGVERLDQGQQRVMGVAGDGEVGMGKVGSGCRREQLAVERRNEVCRHEDSTRASQQKGRKAEIVVPGQDRDPLADSGDLGRNHGEIAFAFLQCDDGRNRRQSLQHSDVERDAGPAGVVVGDDRNGCGVGDAREVLVNARGTGLDVVGRQDQHGVGAGFGGVAHRVLNFPGARRQRADDDRNAARDVIDRDVDHAGALRRREADELTAPADHQQAGRALRDLEIDQPAKWLLVEFVGLVKGRDDRRVNSLGRELHDCPFRSGVWSQVFEFRARTDQSSDSARNRHSAIQ